MILTDYQTAVVDATAAALAAAPRHFRVYHCHSGGGVWGIAVEMPDRTHFFSTLATEPSSPEPCVMFDILAYDGELIGDMSIDCTPWGHPRLEPDEPARVAEQIVRMIDLFESGVL